MTQAYDIKELGERLKSAGVPIALDALESVAENVYVVLKQWIKDSAALSENKIDDAIAPFIDQLDAFVLPQIKKINAKP